MTIGDFNIQNECYDVSKNVISNLSIAYSKGLFECLNGIRNVFILRGIFLFERKFDLDTIIICPKLGNFFLRHIGNSRILFIEEFLDRWVFCPFLFLKVFLLTQRQSLMYRSVEFDKLDFFEVLE